MGNKKIVAYLSGNSVYLGENLEFYVGDTSNCDSSLIQPVEENTKTVNSNAELTLNLLNKGIEVDDIIRLKEENLL